MADLEGGAEEPEVLMRQVRARHDDETLVVYQAYSPAIAEPAVAAGTFVAPFKRERMTWIKPSFNWMMYRCGWATKPGQERVLAVTITRAGFDWALEHSCLRTRRPRSASASARCACSGTRSATSRSSGSSTARSRSGSAARPSTATSTSGSPASRT